MAQITADNHRLRLVVRYTVLALIALIFVFPLVFMIMSSFKPDQQLLQDTKSFAAFLPVGDISLDNYFDAFKRAPVGLFVGDQFTLVLDDERALGNVGHGEDAVAVDRAAPGSDQFRHGHSVGSTRPGLSRLWGSKAAFRRAISKRTRAVSDSTTMP